MNFVVSTKEDMEAWAELGNPGWDWENFSRYLRRTYTVTTGSETANDGTIQTNIPDEETKWPQVWRDTLAGLGFPAHNDPFSGTIHGAVMYPDAIHPETKTRSFAGNAYLAPARDRPNLTVWTSITVEKILFGNPSADGVAIASGVQYTTKEGNSLTVVARKEVILSAGVFHTPKLLELSGIGDAALLSSLGIDVVVDNPYVGENLQHHPLSILSFETVDDNTPGFDTIDALARQDPTALRAAMSDFTHSRGPFSQTNCNAMAHLPFPSITTPSGKADLSQLLTTTPNPSPPASKSTPAYTHFATALTHNTLTSPTAASGYYVTIPGRAQPGPSGRMMPIPSTSSEKYFAIALLLTRPLSRGSAHLTTTTTTTTPNSGQQQQQAIDPGYLSHPLDVEVLARHVRFLEETLVRAEPLASRLKQGGKRTPPGTEFEGDLEKVRAFLRETAVASMLYAGTCSMMPREIGGVVDPALRVYGTKNVRVVDASVMPFITTGDTMATVYGIAEKAAEIIKGEL